MMVGKAFQSLQVKFTKNYLYMDNQSSFVTNILLPLYSLLGGLKGELALYECHSGGRGPRTKKTELTEESTFTSLNSYSRIITHSFKQFFHQSIHFLFCKKTQTVCCEHNFIRGNSKKTMLFSARHLTKSSYISNIHYSKTFTEYQLCLKPVLDTWNT